MPSNDTRNPDPTVRLLAGYGAMLERLERRTGPVDPGQYRLLVERIGAALRGVRPGPDLDALLQASPGIAEIYENLNYRHAGLCLRPLDKAMAAETLACHLIARSRGPGAPAKSG